MGTGPSPLEARPRVLSSQTGRVSTTLGTAFVTLTRDGDEQPFEVFLDVGKAGSETFATAEALGRLISLALRLSSTVSRSERIRAIADQLEHIGSLSNNASLPSIPDALAKVLREFLTEEAPDEIIHAELPEAAPDDQIYSLSPETTYGEPLQRPSPGEGFPAEKFTRNLPTMNLSKKKDKQKKPMDTNYSLPIEILTAAEQLADALLRDGPVAAYERAKARLDGDPKALELLNRFIKTQANLRTRQARNAVTQNDVDELRALQKEVQANRIIIDYAETQQAAVAYLPGINQEISQLLGIDFASLAGPSSC